MTNVYIMPDTPIITLNTLLIFEICVISILLYLFFWDIIVEMYYYYTNQVSNTNQDLQVIQEQKTFLSEFQNAKDTFRFFCDSNDRLMIDLNPGKTSTLINTSIPALTLGNNEIFNCSVYLNQLNDYVLRPRQ